MNRSIEGTLGRLARAALAGGLSALTILSMAACGPEAAPVGPEEELLPPEVAAMGASWTAAVVGSSSVEFVTGIEQRVRLIASRWPDGSVRGRFAGKVTFPSGIPVCPEGCTWTFEVDLDCLVVDGDQAWLGGQVSEVKNAPFPIFAPGDDFIITLADGPVVVGEGAYGPAGAFGTSNCADKPGVPPLAPIAELEGKYKIFER
jgi:hypothetical protein